MKKRIISILTALVLCLSMCPLGASAESSDVLDFTSQSGGVSGEGYTWDAETNTLTLNNFTQIISDTTDSIKAIKLPADTTLVLEGTSTITNQSYGGVCIEYTGELTVKGDGTLNLNLDI